LFERKGIITVPKENIKDPEAFELEVIDAGAEDIEDSEDFMEITTALEDFGKLRKKLEEMDVEFENAELQRIPNDFKKLDLEASLKVLKIVEEFEDDDDVQNVFHNLEMTEEVMQALES
jgi:transcriptional/translational regulatory protein YebC/TACO1